MRTLPLLALCLGFVTAAGCGKSNPAPSGGEGRTVPAGRPDDTPPAIPGGEQFENPNYKLWDRFPVGTCVTQRTTTENEDNTAKTVTTIKYTLKQKADDYLLLESQATTVHYTGRTETNPPDETKIRKTFTLPPGAKPPTPPKAESGTETLTVAGKEYQTRWVKGKDHTEAGELLSQTWSSDEMPGGLVKSVSKVPAKRATITVEVIDVKIP
jgi:hypothetical protein